MIEAERGGDLGHRGRHVCLFAADADAPPRAGGAIHDMFADGTLSSGVNAIGEGGAQVSVAARFEDGRLNLYPGDKGVVVVTRYLDGDEMIWRWGPYKNRLRRLDA